MTFYRPESLRSFLMCLVVGLVGSAMQGGQQSSAQQPQSPPPAQQKPAQQQPPPPQQPRRPNPFETVPSAPAQPAPAQPKLQQPANRPAPATEVKPTQPGAAPPQDIIEDITFRGSRRVPQDTLRALIYTRKGDRYDEERLRRDFVALWNTGRFDYIRLEREAGASGWILTDRTVSVRIW